MLRRGLTVTVLCAALLAPQSAVAAPGSPAPARDPRVDELQGLVGEASKEEAAALQSLQAVRNRRQQLDRQVRALDVKIADATGRLHAAEAEAQRLGGAYVEQSRRVDETDAQLEGARTEFEQSVARLYRRGGDASTAFAELFAHTESLREHLAGRAYLSRVADTQRLSVEGFVVVRDDAIRQRDALDGQRQLAEAAKAGAARDAEALARLRAEQDKARREVAGEEAHETQIVSDIVSKKDEYTRQLSELTAVSETIAVELSRRQAGQKAGSTRFQRPITGPIVSGFGVRVHPIFKTKRMHSGIDFEAGTGTPIRAAAGGVVAIAGVRGGYGSAVVIDHGNRLATVYGHQSRIAVTVGQAVTTGQVIGYVGSSGWATGPHLHFEVRVLGTPVNPVQYL